MLFQKLLHPMVKQASEALVTSTSTEVITLVDRHVDDTAGIVEAGILIVGLVASIVLPKNPLGGLLRALRSSWY